MLGVFTAVLLAIVPSYGVAEMATCIAGYTWSFNSQGRSPCEVASALLGVCNSGGDSTIPPLPTGSYYLGPGADGHDECRCNSVYYSMLSACAVCQGHDYLLWSTYSTNCTAPLLRVFPDTLPAGLRVPHYAYLDVSAGDKFNVTLAQAAGGTESTSLPSATTSGSGGYHTTLLAVTTRPISKSSPYVTNPVLSSIRKPDPGAIVGGVFGGILFLGLTAAVVWWLLKRRGNAPWAHAQYHSDRDTLLSKTPSRSHTGSSFSLSTQHLIYNPSDPRTFPENQTLPALRGTFQPSRSSSSLYQPLLPVNYVWNPVPPV